ncbi:MAG: complex I NDUFA9 subunit family protein [Deferribacterales bacterium]
MKKVLITGATGFVGNAVIESLNRHGYTPYALIRRGSEKKLKHPAVELYGDVLDHVSLTKAMHGMDAVIHLVGIIREFPRKWVTFENMHTRASENVASAAAECGVKRFIHMSANGTRENAVSMYHITKCRGENAVMTKGLDYTIFRPSLIYGPQDTFINMLAGYMKKTPVFSYFGNGSYPMQPIYVQDVADCFVKAIETPETIGKTYSLCGPDAVTYKELLQMISRVLGKSHLLLPVPEVFIKAAIGMFGKTDWFPITKDQFIMLTEGNVCPEDSAFTTMGIERHKLEETVKGYLK